MPGEYPMPFLAHSFENERTQPETGSGSLLPECANTNCSSGWLHLWRRRRVPVLEGGWLCSPACTQARVQELINRELRDAMPAPETHRHRIPLGLVMLSAGWITHDHLKKALQAQKAGAKERIGEWLVKHCGLEEQRVTQALSLQWNCPIFSRPTDQTGFRTSPIPRIFVETFGILPLRLSATGILYAAFEDRIDHSLTLALERMTGLRVEVGLLGESDFYRHSQNVLSMVYPRAQLMEARSAKDISGLLTRLLEKEKPADARLVRIHDFFWLRFWKEGRSNSEKDSPLINDLFSDSIQDVICSVTTLES
jgi:hypothetical protein